MAPRHQHLVVPRMPGQPRLRDLTSSIAHERPVTHLIGLFAGSGAAQTEIAIPLKLKHIPWQDVQNGNPGVKCASPVVREKGPAKIQFVL